ncbi:MAG: ABC transporter permease [Rhodothermaceae bacterium]|nr:ABC transporter permease [Rhodothermaceae bacterium]
MLRSYFLIAFRHLLKYKTYTSIRLLGIAGGMAFFLLIMLFVGHEYNVNRQFEAGDRLYRVQSIWHEQDNAERLLSFSPLAEALREDFSAVQNAMRYTAISADFIANETPFRSATVIADAQLFEMFDFEFAHGSREASLAQPYSAVLSEKEALRFFGRTDVIGEAIRIAGWDGDDVQDFQITGVFADPDYNSVSFIGRQPQDVILPFENATLFFEGSSFDTDWAIYNTVTYVELKEGREPHEVEEQLPELLAANLPPQFQDRVSLRLESLTSLHFNENEGAVGRLVKMLMLIAVLILAIACFNFVNISMSLATVRSKEVGLRKMLGAGKGQLVGQFFGESVLVSVIGMMLAFIIVYVVLPLFNGLIDRELSIGFDEPWLWATVGGTILLTALFSGGYPAVFLSSIKPIYAIKEVLRSGRMAMQVRRTLVVLQFVVAIGMIVGAVFISRQVSLIANKDVGFEKDQLFVVSSLPRTWTQEGVQQLEVIKREIKSLPGVQEASIAWGPPGPRYTGVSFEFRKEGEDVADALSIPLSHVDYDYESTIGIDLIAGQFFDARGAAPDSVVVLNETAVQALGLGPEPVGQHLFVGSTPFRITGVVSDYNTIGLEHQIGPLALVDVRQFPLYRELLIRVHPDEIASVQQGIREVWPSIYPDVVLETYAVDEQWADLHQWITRTEYITRSAAGFSVFIALIGLLGLVSISIGQRTREIGVRKVLGANLAHLIRLLSKEYVVLILIAFSISVPLSYIAVEYWLENFVDRISLSPLPFALVGIVLLVGVLFMISMQTLRAARANPVDTLRQE